MVVVPVAVASVAQNGVAQLFQVASNLVLAACLWPAGKQAQSRFGVTADREADFGYGKTLKVGVSGLSGLVSLGKPVCAVIEFFLQGFLATERLGSKASGNGEVMFAYATFAEALRQLPGNCWSSCKQNHARGGSIQTMNAVNARLAQMLAQPANKGVGFSRCEWAWVHQQPGWFADCQQGVILIEDAQLISHPLRPVLW